MAEVENLTPIEKKERAQVSHRAEREAQAQKAEDDFKQAVLCSSTNEGRQLVRVILRLCGFRQDSVVIGGNGDVSVNLTIAFAARKSVAEAIWERLPKEVRMKIEEEGL